MKWYEEYGSIINIIGLVSSFVTIGTAIYAIFLKKRLNKTEKELISTQDTLNRTNNELLELKMNIKNSGNFNNKGVNYGNQFGMGCGIHGNTFNIENRDK